MNEEQENKELEKVRAEIVLGGMAMSEGCGPLVDALAKAQGEMENVTKDGLIKGGKSKSSGKYMPSRTYSTLAGVLNVIRKPLSSNGIAQMQFVTTGSNLVTVTTTLMLGNHYITNSISARPVNVGGTEVQGSGATITYLRRYALMAALGLAPEDEDGEGAVQEDKNPQHSQNRDRPEPKPKVAPKHGATDDNPYGEPPKKGFIDDKDRKAFMASLMSDYGLKYEDLKGFLKARADAAGRAFVKPSQLTHADRQRLFVALGTSLKDPLAVYLQSIKTEANDDGMPF